MMSYHTIPQFMVLTARQPRFLLNTPLLHQSSTHQDVTVPAPERLLKEALRRAGHAPMLMATDSRPEYRTAHRKHYAMGPNGRVSRHLSETRLRGERCNNNAMERLNGTFRDRLKATHRIGKVTSEWVRRYANYYNFFRPHMGLDGNTPADRAGIIIEGPNK